MKKLLIPEGSVYTGELILVNARHPCHESVKESSLVPVNAGNDTVLLERRSAVLLSRLMNDIDGWTRIAAVSGWRSRREQQDIFSRSLMENGPAFTEKFVAKPDHSEHQIGLAIDLGLRQPDIDFIRPDFPYSGICQSFRDKAQFYGFIERYPAGKEAITGIAQEPWHFRYVGIPHAAVMTESGFSLEEYHAFLKQFPYGRKRFDYRKGRQHIAVSYVQASDGDIELDIDDTLPYSISGNNADGLVLTEWRDGC